MDIYIDKENLISMIDNRDSSLYEDGMRLIKKQLNAYFNFPKSALSGNQQLTQWLTTLTSGVGVNNKLEFGGLFPTRPLKSNSATSFNGQQLSSVYLVNDEDAPKLINAGTVLICEPNKELETLHRLTHQQDDYGFTKTCRIGGKEFQCWADLACYSMPLTDIIIIDQYVTNDKSLIPSNLATYLEVLTENITSKVNVVLYTNRNETIDYKDLSPVIRDCLKKSTGKGPNFTMVTYFPKDKDKVEHDRTILTNYTRIYSGHSLNYFDSKGDKITTGREIQYFSLAKHENHELAKELITDLQKNIDELKKGGGHGIEGDKKSGYLTF